jgi:lambda repressor-like predicted transcriptional regulator
MHPADINAHIEKMGLNQSAIGDMFGVSRAAIAQVIRGKSRSKEIERRLGELMNLPLHVLWPDHYPKPEGTTEDPDAPTPYRKGTLLKNEGVEQLVLTLWRRMDTATQMHALELLSGLATTSPAGTRADAMTEHRNNLKIAANHGQVNQGGVVINEGKKK